MKGQILLMFSVINKEIMKRIPSRWAVNDNFRIISLVVAFAEENLRSSGGKSSPQVEVESRSMLDSTWIDIFTESDI